MKESKKIIGVRIDILPEKRILDIIKIYLKGKGPRQINTVNPEFVVEARRDSYFRNILNSSDLNVADGVGLVWLGGIKTGRIPGIELLLKICDIAAKEGRSCFLFGGKKKVAGKTKVNLEKLFPSLRIIGVSENREKAKISIKEQKPDIVFVALGAPQQEKWIYENKQEFSEIKILMGVGGSFDIISGRIKRAPRFMRKAGLEWLWRLAREPGRFRRILRAVFVFPFYFLFSRRK